MKVAVVTLLCPFALAAQCTTGPCMEDETNLLQTQKVVRHRPELLKAVAMDYSKLPKAFTFWGHEVRTLHRHRESTILLEISDAMIDPPSKEPQVLNNRNAKTYSQWKQDLLLMPILGKLSPGFFVESGALNGEKDSNTLLYELNKSWTGLLVEPNPKEYMLLKKKKRHAYVYNGCLSPDGTEQTLEFTAATADPRVGQISDTGSDQFGPSVLPEDTYSVQAQPLQALLKKIGRSTVDFWSLDIEGSESAVLHSTNFSQVEVGLMLIEMNKDDDNNKGVREVMEREGFKNIGHSLYDEGMGRAPLDQIFVNPKYFQKRGLKVPTAQDLPEAQGRNTAWKDASVMKGVMLGFMLGVVHAIATIH